MAGSDTIAALSSGGLPAGVAVVRISGPGAQEALKRLADGVPEPRRAVLRRIRSASGEVLDRGLVLFFPGPNSVTGEDLAEFHLHGGRAVVSACLEALTALPGMRLAEAGEFTRRAFDNGRIDLTEAEGLADLLAAETEEQRRLAVAQAGGALRTLYEDWMRRLTEIRAMLEASLDFSDEGDVGEEVARRCLPRLAALAAEMRAHLAEAHRGEILRSGYKVVIAGPPNAGKSSLLNRLAERDVAIVSDIPGTTRDVLEVVLDLGGIPVRFSDTAGLRQTSDVVEAMGVERAEAAIASADLVLVLRDAPGAAEPPFPAEDPENARQARLLLRSKSDLGISGPAEAGMPVSSVTGEGLTELVAHIAGLAREAAGAGGTLAVPARMRHREILGDALSLLDGVLDQPDLPEDLAAELLRRVSDRLGALTGRVGVEELLDVIFSEFCIGK